MKSVEILEKTTFSGRRFTRKQLAQVQETVQTFQNLSLRELANTICEHLDWKNAKGSYKVQSCLTLLDELQARDIVKLPTKVKSRAPVRSVLEPKEPEISIDADLDAISPVTACVLQIESYGHATFRAITTWAINDPLAHIFATSSFQRHGSKSSVVCCFQPRHPGLWRQEISGLVGKRSINRSF